MKRGPIGVLALQGDFAKHIEMLRSIGCETLEVRKPADLDSCEGLIIPGGESTVMFRQLDFIKMKEKLSDFAKVKPIFGTCAGLILISHKIQSSPLIPLHLIDVEVERNAFGRQTESFHTWIKVELQKEILFEAFFIRAPRIRAISSNAKVLASYQNEPVLVEQGIHLGATFHPELTKDASIHQYFVEKVYRNAVSQSNN